MRILYLISNRGDGLDLGGLETYGRELSEAIAARGHEVESVPLYGPDIVSSFTLSDRLPRRKLLNRFYWWRGTYQQDYRFHNAVKRISKKVMRRFSPDIIHCMHVDHFAAVADANRPYIVTCNGLEVVDTPPTRQILEKATTIHAISNYTKGRAEQIAPAGHHCVLSWGIREPQEPSSRPPTYDLITVGRLVPRKNIQTVLHALKSLPEVRYAIVGDGPEMANLRDIVARNHMDNVTFFGAVSHREKRDLLSRSRVFVMCPTHRNDDVEGLGLVYYEAHAAGLPAIAARSGGAPEAIGDGGLLVSDPTNATELAEAITTALNPEAYTRLRLAVRKRQSTHSWDRFVTDFEEQYQDAIRRYK